MNLSVFYLFSILGSKAKEHLGPNRFVPDRFCEFWFLLIFHYCFVVTSFNIALLEKYHLCFLLGIMLLSSSCLFPLGTNKKNGSHCNIHTNMPDSPSELPIR